MTDDELIDAATRVCERYEVDALELAVSLRSHPHANRCAAS